MITKSIQNSEIIRYLEQDTYTNLNILNYLQYNRDADVYLSRNDPDRGVIVGDKAQDFFFLATDCLDFLAGFWALLPPGDKCFSAVPKPIALAFCRDKDVQWQSPCRTYVLKGAFERPSHLPYADESLTLEDAEEVDRYYTFRSEDSIHFMRENISLRESACIRIDGELAAWCTVHAEDGSMGPLYTKEAYRGRGLAHIVLLRLMDKLIANGVTRPYAHIAENNTAPLRLIEKIPGMAYNHDCIWFGVGK